MSAAAGRIERTLLLPRNRNTYTPVSVGRAAPTPTSPPTSARAQSSTSRATCNIMCLHLGHLMADPHISAANVNTSQFRADLLGRMAGPAEKPAENKETHDLRSHPSGRA